MAMPLLCWPKSGYRPTNRPTAAQWVELEAANVFWPDWLPDAVARKVFALQGVLNKGQTWAVVRGALLILESQELGYPVADLVQEILHAHRDGRHPLPLLGALADALEERGHPAAAPGTTLYRMRLRLQRRCTLPLARSPYVHHQSDDEQL